MTMGRPSFYPRAGLDIDAACTDKQPSGIAAALETASGWRLAALAASCEANGLAGNDVLSQRAAAPSRRVQLKAELRWLPSLAG